MDPTPPDKIKTEPDLEQQIPRFLMPASSTSSSTVETIDLTNDAEYLCEFQSFLQNISAHRKESGRKLTRQHQKKNIISDVLPLQVVHLQAIDFYQDSYVCSLFGIDFKNVMIYGRLTPGPVRQENNTHVYKLDDGSGTVDVHYAHGLKRDLDNLTSANICENILSTRRSVLNEERVPTDPQLKADLKLLLSLVKTRCQQRVQYFPLGTRCFAIGRPFLNRHDRVSLYAHSMHADDGADSAAKSVEVFWKSYLAQYYEQRYQVAAKEGR